MVAIFPRFLAVLGALMFLGTACTTSDPGDTGDADTSVAGPEVAQDGGPTSADNPATDDQPPSLADLEAEWADARAAVVERLSSSAYGVGPDGILRGPGGLEVDLSNCPADWSDTAGITDDTITIGHTAPLTGGLVGLPNTVAGIETYFNSVNENGGVAGRKLQLLVRDDAFDTQVMVQAIESLLTTDTPFLISTLGSTQPLAVYDLLGEQCIPNPFVVGSSHPAWADPVAHPFTSGLHLLLSTEARLWGEWVLRDISDPSTTTIVGMVEEGAIGASYRAAFEDWLDATEVEVGDTRFLTGSLFDIGGWNEVQELTEEPIVAMLMTSTAGCQPGISVLAESQVAASGTAFIRYDCNDPETYMVPFDDSVDGFIRIGSVGQLAEADPSANPFVALAYEMAADFSDDPAVERNFVQGFGLYGWAHVETLRIAAELPGGLTRSNYLLAMWGLDLVHPMLLDGVQFSVNGAEDAHYIEGSDFLRYDAAAREWVPEGEVIDLNGQTPNCTWLDGRCNE